MPKPVEIEHHQWEKLSQQLHRDYPRSIMILRKRMKEKLGFTVREYKDWDQNIGKYGGYRKNCIMLDFYSETKRTFFIMKYSGFIGKDYIDDNF